jgi:catechol 2,3-dioxygenase-like lactoylglutathione lyase family enzyme
MTLTAPSRAGFSTPLIHVKDVERSIRFYELLGFQLADHVVEGGHASWARMHCEGGAVMFLAVEEEIRPREQNIQLYLYTPDLPALRDRLLAAGIEVTEIRRPGYMPSGEVQVRDPDGYAMWIGHWGKEQQESWEKQAHERMALRAAERREGGR